MACMEYECRRCGHFWSNNQPLGLAGCPKCCSQDVRKDFDEPLASHVLHEENQEEWRTAIEEQQEGFDQGI